MLAVCAGVSAQQQAVISQVSPVQYKHEGGKYEILSYVKSDASLGKKVRVNSDGVKCEVQVTPRPDSVLVWLPMIGGNMEVEVLSGGKTVSRQMCAAFIPDDWGYFAGGTIHLIQSSHQDIAWMDTPDYCRKDRIEKIILPALDMMKENPEFKFEMEQTLNLMEFLDEHPERKDELVKLYGEGRFGWGATYNQPYEGLSSGEQLVRQAYYGRKWIRENLPGCDDRVANNIDVPGRTLQMPQILAKSGIPNLFISRMGEGLYDWYSPDGSKVLVFTPGNYGWAAMMWKFFDADGVTAMHKLHHRSQLWSGYFEKHGIPPHYAVLMSCDATKPVDYQKVVDQWNEIAMNSGVALPRLSVSTSEEYFNAVRGEDTEFEAVSGERPDLWLYIHGPAHYEATLFKRKAAAVLPAAEAFTTFASLLAGSLESYPRAEFDRAWMASIYPDHGLGGKHGDITDAIFEDSLELACNMGKGLLDKAAARLASMVNATRGEYVVFNPLSWSRDGMVCVAAESDKVVVKDEKGNVMFSQMVEKDGKKYVAFMAEDVPAMGYRTYSVSGGRKQRGGLDDVRFTSNSFENSFYKAVLGNGGIVSLYDKKLGKELVHTSKFACGDVLELGYTGNGAGEFTRIQDVTPGDIRTLGSYGASVWKVAESGSLFTRFECETSTAFAVIRQEITFWHDERKIDFDVTLENFTGEHNRQYRIAFPLNMHGERTVNYEVPMAVAQVGRDELGIQPGGWAWGGTYVHHPADTHPREILNFISASGNGFGVTMSSCVAVADWIDPSREAASYPVLQGILLSSHKSCHGEGNWYHQTGTHSYHFSLSSHDEGWQNGYCNGIEANSPLLAVQKQNDGGELETSGSFMQVSDPLVAVSVVKKADNDNGVILRLAEMEGVDKQVTVTLPFDVKRVVRTNLIEDEEEELDVSGRKLVLKLGHHAIETFKLVM